MHGAAANDMGPANLRVVPPGIRVPLRIEAILALKDCGLPLGEEGRNRNHAGDVSRAGGSARGA